MFTGIIKHLGKIRSIQSANDNSAIYWEISCPEIVNKIQTGSSITHDGACLTVIEILKDSYKIQLIPETLRKTNFQAKKVGDILNLELSLTAESVLDGHLVQGHIDGIGKVIFSSRDQIGIRDLKVQDFDEDWVLKIQLEDPELIRYIANKGSITVNGTSLTVSKTGNDWFEVSLIQHTIMNTNLGSLLSLDLVNLEVDLMARYIVNFLERKEQS
jgi:riboflavin synthase